MSEVGAEQMANNREAAGIAEGTARYGADPNSAKNASSCANAFRSARLGDVAHIEMGQSPDSRFVSEDMDQGVPFLQGNAEFGPASPRPRFSCTRPMKLSQCGDLLISVRAPVGEINRSEQIYCIGRGLAAIRLAAVPMSLAAHIVASATPALRRVAQGTTFEAINKNDLCSVSIRLPPESERQPLARIVDTLDTTIRQTEAIIAKLKQVKQGLLHDLLTRGIDANGELRPSQSQASHLYKQSPVGLIPDGWDVRQVRDICALGRGRVISQGDLERNPGEYPVYSSQTKDDGVFGYLATFDFEGPYVTWTTDGANAGTVFYRAGRFNCTNVCGTLRASDERTDLEYVALALAGATSRFVSRVGNDKLMNNIVARIHLPVPAHEEQHEISKRLHPISSRLEKEVRDLEKLQTLKLGLMDDLLTGRVRVTPLLAAATTP